MTLFLPLAAGTPLPSTPSFLSGSSDSQAQISKVAKSILKARRIVVICGAGISVQAGIPDFRSSDGLFKTLKRENPREALTSGKDLFDASVFSSEHTTALFFQMIAKLWRMSQAAEPTTFHHLLRTLDERGKLLRVYTQNIDAIEEKCGLSFGIPDFDTRLRGRSKKSTTLIDPSDESSSSDSSKRLSEPPRCIPLHGTLQTLHCQTCHHSYPVQQHLPSLLAGLPPECPECTLMEETRQLVGKRARGIGRLRPSVVLYNEAHRDGEGVGGIVQKDLLGSAKGKGRSGADLLLVVGTSLRVPGTKRMVREFSKAIRSRAASIGANTASALGSSPNWSSPNEEELAIKTIYLNLDFPVPTREWEGVFDAWVQGDAQVFARMLQEAMEQEVKPMSEKKRRREEPFDVRGSLQTPLGTPPERSQAKPFFGQSSKKAKGIHSPASSLASQKLCIRIPARRVLPEVCITVPPPICKRPILQQLPTPEKSPPLKFKLATEAGRKSAGAARKERHSALRSKPTHPPDFLLDSPQSSDNDASIEQYLLPNPFARTAQHSLRGAVG